MSEDTGKKNGGAQHHNIRAARTVAETVKSTLGPKGMDKMMVDGGGNVIVTNDGATILRELDLSHPGGKMIAEIAKTQEALCYDGTTSTVVLAGALLSNSEALFDKGLHPNVINRGYHTAAQMAVECLSDMAVDSENDDDVLVQVAKTAITGKTLENALEKVSALCVEAVKSAGSAEDVRVVSFPGGSIEDSHLFDGLIVARDYVLESESGVEFHEILLLNGGLEHEKSEENVQLQVDAQSYQSYKKSSKLPLVENAKRVQELLPNGGVIFVRDGVDDMVCNMLKKSGIMVVRRTPESTLKSLTRLTGGQVAQTPEDALEAVVATVDRQKHNDVWYLFVSLAESNNQHGTLILRGATSHTLDEIERGFDDALGVVSLVLSEQQYVYGGGSTYIRMASHLRQHAATIGGRAQMAIEAFAEALETIPATIAENAGLDPLDTVLELRHEALGGAPDAGVDVEHGGSTSMKEQGVYEPLSLVRQAILSATEVTTAILRIDDIIARRPSQ